MNSQKQQFTCYSCSHQLAEDGVCENFNCTPMTKPQPIPKRPGRKPTGRINRVISITIPPAILGRIDHKRGKISRSKYIASKLKD